jgi:hypothetical protein
MLDEIQIGSQMLYLIALILFLSLLVLIKIADFIKKSNFNNANKIIEKHFYDNSENRNESKNDKTDLKKENSLSDIDEAKNLDEKWSNSKKSKSFESNMDGLGDKNVTNGSSSLDAVQLMRNMKRKEKDCGE